MFLPPAIGLSGDVVGYADELCDEDFCATSVTATDMRHPNDVHGFLNGSYAGGRRGHRLVKVGSLRVARDGMLVWIACPERTNRYRLSGARGPNCLRPDDLDTVYLKAARADAPRKRLDRGRHIDPSSLRIRGGRAYWLDKGRRRSAAAR